MFNIRTTELLFGCINVNSFENNSSLLLSGRNI